MRIDSRDLGDLIAVHQAGTLSAAAKLRGVAISTISRRIDSLEVDLGLRLVDRRADGVRLTRQGAEIAALAEPLAEQLARVTRAADALRAGTTNIPVRVSATEFVISDVLAPALAGLWQANPGIVIHLQSQADVVSLAARDADIAVRMLRPEGASLVARRLPELRIGLFATRRYLKGRDPSTIDLRGERLMVYDDSYGRLPELDWLAKQGLFDAVTMRTASTRALLTAARAGAGVALLPAVFANREADMIELPLARAIPARQPWLIVHRDLRHQREIRKVHGWILETFKTLVGAP